MEKLKLRYDDPKLEEKNKMGPPVIIVPNLENYYVDKNGSIRKRVKIKK